jgi:phosphate transport system permease protein
MTTNTTDVAEHLSTRGARVRADKVFRWAALTAGMLTLVILAGIAVSTTQKAWPAFRVAGWSYFTSSNWDPTHGHFGILSFVYGSVVVSAIALLLAVPTSVGIALFTTEVSPRRMRSAVITVIDMLASVPSVVFGLVGFLILRPHLKDIYNSIADFFHGVPVLGSIFGQSLSGQSFMTAGLIVGLMIVPIITSITREVFSQVPAGDKQGALALGATRWEMVRGVVFPYSLGGTVGAVMLGLGRALGETIAIALVIGASPQIVANLFSQGDAMPSVIALQLNEADGNWRAALIGLGVVLFALTIIVNVAARGIVGRVDRRLQGAA